jgi:antitoxin FitA
MVLYWNHIGTIASKDMPNLSIKNVPESVLEKLRERAQRNHRSIQGELMALVSEAVEPGVEGRKPLGDMNQRERGTKSVEEIWAALRAKSPLPVAEAPTAVEIIRADRDGR